jgi:autotransporter-associated beta strand protein
MRLVNVETSSFAGVRIARPRVTFAGQRSASASRLNGYLLWLSVVIVAAFSWQRPVHAQTNNYFGLSGSLSGNSWSTTAGGSPSGTYNQPFATTGGGIANFENAASFSGGSITVAGINATANATLSPASGTITNFNNGVIPIDVVNGVTLDFGSQSFTSSITAGYIKNGGGTLALRGNAYRGGFTLNAGTAIMRHDEAFGSGLGNTLKLYGGTIGAIADRSLASEYGGGIQVHGNFTLGSSATPAIIGANINFSGNAMNLQGGTRTITIGGTGNYTFQGAITNGTLQVDATNSGTISLNGADTLPDGLNVLGGKVVAFTNAIGDTSPVTLSGGTFQLSTNATDTVGLVTLSGGTIELLGSGVLTSDTGYGFAVQAGTITGRISGSGAVTKTTGGTVTLNGATNNYTGGTFVNGGELFQGSAGQFPTSQPITIGGGTLNIGDSNSSPGLLTLTSGTLTGGIGRLTTNTGFDLQAGTISALLGGTGAMTKSTGGLVDITSTDNNRTGQIFINNGVLRIASIAANVNGNSSLGSASITAPSHIQFGGGTLRYAGGSVSTSRGFTLNAGGGGIDVEQAATTLTWEGNSVGDGNFTKSGDGTLVLATGSTHTSTGSTFISAGRLVVNGSQSGGSGYSVGADGTLAGSGTIEIGTNTMNVAGTLAPGNSAGVLAVEGQVEFISSALLDWDLAAPNTLDGDRIDIDGDLTLDGTLDVTALAGFGTPVLGDRWRLINYTGDLTDNGLSLGTLPALDPGLYYSIDTSFANQVDLTVVPEPSSLAMFLFGAILLWFFRTSFARQ